MNADCPAGDYYQETTPANQPSWFDHIGTALRWITITLGIVSGVLALAALLWCINCLMSFRGIGH